MHYKLEYEITKETTDKVTKALINLYDRNKDKLYSNKENKKS